MVEIKQFWKEREEEYDSILRVGRSGGAELTLRQGEVVIGGPMAGLCNK